MVCSIVRKPLKCITTKIEIKNLSRVRVPHDTINRYSEVIRVIRIASTSADKLWRVDALDREWETTICNSNVGSVGTKRDTTWRVCHCSIKRIVFPPKPSVNGGPSWFRHIQFSNPDATISRSKKKRIIIRGEGNLQCSRACWVLDLEDDLPCRY